MNNVYTITGIVVMLGLGLACKPQETREGGGPKAPADSEVVGTEPFESETMVWIDGGSYQMGFATGQQDEQPVHTVKLDGFWIGKYEVTNAEFEAFSKESGYKTIAERVPSVEDYPDIPPENRKAGSIVFVKPTEDIPVEMLKNHNMFGAWWDYVFEASWRLPEGPGKPGYQDKMDHPVVHISYFDAMKYCEWKTKKTGIKHRLPTEAEWEYAARGGLKGKEYIWGDEQEPEGRIMANIWQGRFPKENTKKDGYYTTAPVGKYPPNGYGLFDMGGNVWEWCYDWYMPNYYGNSPISNPKGPNESYDPNEPNQWKRVQRGGSFLCSDLYCGSFRPSRRMKTTPDTGMSHAGFRVVAEAPAPKK